MQVIRNWNLYKIITVSLVVCCVRMPKNFSVNSGRIGKSVNIARCILLRILNVIIENEFIEASRGAAARGVSVKLTGCGFDPHSRRWNIYLNLYFHFFALVSRLSAALSSATQHAMPPEFGRKWGTQCHNTKFPLPTLLHAGYSVKLKKNILRTYKQNLTTSHSICHIISSLIFINYK